MWRAQKHYRGAAHAVEGSACWGAPIAVVAGCRTETEVATRNPPTKPAGTLKFRRKWAKPLEATQIRVDFRTAAFEKPQGACVAGSDQTLGANFPAQTSGRELRTTHPNASSPTPSYGSKEQEVWDSPKLQCPQLRVHRAGSSIVHGAPRGSSSVRGRMAVFRVVVGLVPGASGARRCAQGMQTRRERMDVGLGPTGFVG